MPVSDGSLDYLRTYYMTRNSGQWAKFRRLMHRKFETNVAGLPRGWKQ